MRDVLRVPGFRWLFAGSAASALGDTVFPVAVSVLVLEDGGDAGDLGLVLASRFVAIVLFALLGGVWADRLPRVRVLVGADLLRFVAVVGLLLSSASTPPVPVLAALVFAVGAGEAFFRPAYGALLPTILPGERLAQGNALSSSTNQLAQVIGPGLGGILIALAGPSAGFALDAGLFLLSALLLRRVREPAPAPREHASVLREIRGGMQAVLERRWIAACLAMFTVNMLLVVAPVTVLLPIVVRDATGEAAAYGVVLGVGALGGLVGAWVASRYDGGPRRGRTAVLVVSAFALQPLALLLHLPVAALCATWVVTGASIAFFIVTWETSLQRAVPRDLLARVVSLDWMATFALFPVGLALTGPLVDLIGRDAVLGLALAAALVPPWVVLRVPGVRAFTAPDRVGA